MAVQRRLAAILAADVAGYSGLMGEDEEATLGTLKTYRKIIDGLIVRHDGRVFSTGGDSVLAEFGSVVEAVRAAISIQEDLTVRNAELAEDRRMSFRRERHNEFSDYPRGAAAPQSQPSFRIGK